MINIVSVEIPFDKLLARLGYLKAKTELDAKTETLIKENLALAQKLIKPKIALVCGNIKISGNIINFEDGYKIESADIAKLLTGCAKAYGIAVTIGSAIEAKRDSLIAEKETFAAIVFDAAGSVAVEELITAVNKQLQEKENTTKRFSPGYGDWNLSSQTDFLKWIGAEKIGITLTPNFLMKPEKSVSAIIGVKEI